MTDRVPWDPVDGTARNERSASPDLLRAARRAARRAYAPHSRFPVGAALLDEGGATFLGANIENASYPLGICAERLALQIWRQEGGGRIRQVVIHTGAARPAPPCGLCREALRRWAPDAEVFLSSRQEVAGPYTAASWLPDA